MEGHSITEIQEISLEDDILACRLYSLTHSEKQRNIHAMRER